MPNIRALDSAATSDLPSEPSKVASWPERPPTRPPRAHALNERLREWALGGTLGDWATVPESLWHRVLLGPAEEFLARPGKRFRSRLLAHAWRLAGGNPSGPAAELAAAIELIHAGSLIVDDIEDDSSRRRGAPALHVSHGVPLALNTGNWLYFVPFVLLGGVSSDAEITARLYRHASFALAQCHQGQALDLGVRADDLSASLLFDAVKTATELKTGALMGLAAALAATAAGAPAETIAALRDIGGRIGVGLQMLDDLGGISSDARWAKGREDLVHSRLTWPWAWLARTVTTTELAAIQHMSWTAHREADYVELCEAIRAALGDTGPRQIRAHNQQLLSDLRALIHDPPAIDAVERELHHLECSYG